MIATMPKSRIDQLLKGKSPAPSIQTYEEGFENGKKAGFEEGLKKGLKEGQAHGLANGRAEGRKEGRTEGYEAGRVAGFTQGYNEGGLFISHKYVAAIELKLCEHDGYKDITTWRHEGKIPAWWIAALMELYIPLGQLLKVKPPGGEGVK